MSVQCWACGRKVRIYTPAAGDGSAEVYSLHRVSTEPGAKYCHGSKGLVERARTLEGK